MATFSTGERKNRPKGDRRSIEATSLIKQTFESSILVNLFPRSQIDIYVQVLQSDGGDLAVCINAASLALIDAGIPMRDFVCACSAGYIDDKPFVDINYIEKTAKGPSLTLANLPKSEKIVLLLMESTVHEDNLKKVMDMGMKGCQMVYTVLNTFVREHLKANLK
jgi:exosome complex component RRP41